jgi:hypothetical protein
MKVRFADEVQEYQQVPMFPKAGMQNPAKQM